MLIHASLEAMDFSQSFASQGICDSVQFRNRTESQSLETAQLFSGQALRYFWLSWLKPFAEIPVAMYPLAK